MSRRVLIAALAVCTLLGCNGKKKAATMPPGGNDAGTTATAGDPEACAAQRNKVESLYRAQAGEPPADPGERARYDEAIADNTHMVMVDCRTSPARFAPCLASATDVAFIEASCLEPLDDAGTVEGVHFGQN